MPRHAAPRGRRPVLIVMAAAACAAAPGVAHAARPIPAKATIAEGVGMAGLRVENTNAILKRWGSSCVESSCGWTLASNRKKLVFYNYEDPRATPRRFMGTNIPGWTTRQGIGPGDTVADLRAAYPSGLRSVRRCLPNGAVNIRSTQAGLALIRRDGKVWRYTFFRTGTPAKRISEIVVGVTPDPVPPRARCIDSGP